MGRGFRSEYLRILSRNVVRRASSVREHAIARATGQQFARRCAGRFRTMKKVFFPAVMLFLFTGCVTVRERGDTSLPTWRTFHARFDRVWGVLVSEISSFAVIETIDKTNGLITTGPLKMSSGLMSEILLKLYARRPSNILGTWDDARAVLSFLVTAKGSSTTVRITARFTGFENNVTHSWMEWPTRGVLENFLLDRIANDLGAPSGS